MKRYYFDIRDGSQFIRDDEGVELAHNEAAREEASTALSEIAREWASSRPHHRIAIEVRDDHGPILQASVSFDAYSSDGDQVFQTMVITDSR